MLYVFVGCLTFGVVYSVLSLILGGHGFDHGADGADINGHAGGDHADVPSPFNPLVIASAITTFGAVGLIGQLGFKMADIISLIFALVFAFIVGVVVFFGVVRLMYSSQSNSAFFESDLIGVEAKVITPIPNSGTGEIAYVINGERHNLSAKSSHDEDFARGESVIIRDISGRCAFVSRKITIDDYADKQDNE